jgi:hypothetical protein
MKPSLALVAGAALFIGGCDKGLGRGPELADGCYYAGEAPILKIEGNDGRVLIAGEVQSFEVERNEGKYVSRAVFSPGFELVSGPPLRTKLDPRFPRSYYMMVPGEVPTIMMVSDNGGINLRLGSPC